MKRMPQATTMIRASQNGKKPLRGPSGPHPKPSRTASKRTTPPKNINTDAVTSSAARILFLEQPAFGHQVTVELFVLLHPFDVLRARCKARLERVIFHVFLKVGRLRHVSHEAYVPLDSLFRHIRRAKNTAQHQIMDVGAEGFFDGRDSFPLSDRNPCRVEDGEGTHSSVLPVAHALCGIVDR